MRVYFFFTVMLPSPELGFGMRVIVVTRRILLLQPCRCFSQNKDRFDACMGIRTFFTVRLALPCIALQSAYLAVPLAYGINNCVRVLRWLGEDKSGAGDGVRALGLGPTACIRVRLASRFVSPYLSSKSPLSYLTFGLRIYPELPLVLSRKYILCSAFG